MDIRDALTIATTIVIVCVLLISISIRSNRNDNPNGYTYGEVYGDFNANGTINGSINCYQQEALLRVLSGHVRIVIWNMTDVKIGTHIGGQMVYTDINIEENPIIIENDACYLEYYTLTGRGQCTLSEFYGENNDEIYDFYMNYSSYFFEGILNNNPNRDYDLLLRNAHMSIGNITLDYKQTNVIFNESQYPLIQINASGWGLVNPFPIFFINGSLEIQNFNEMTENRRLIQHHNIMEFSSQNISLRTIEQPISDYIRSDYVLVRPWFIEIYISDYMK